GQDVEKRKRQAAREGAAREPLQLLAQDARGRMAKAVRENQPGQNERAAEVHQLDLVEQDARANPRQKAQRGVGYAEVQEQEQKRRPVNKGQLREFLERTLRALRKNQGEVQEQRRRQQPRHHARPVDFVIESVELPAVVEAVENERHQAEN